MRGIGEMILPCISLIPTIPLSPLSNLSPEDSSSIHAIDIPIISLVAAVLRCVLLFEVISSSEEFAHREKP